MVNPAIQNDFSYYRRVLSRMRSGVVKMNDEGGKKKGKKGKKGKEEPEDKVTEEIANKMSFFFAYPTPMMRVILDTTRNITSSAQLIPGLALIANVACNLVETNAYVADCLRLLMTHSISQLSALMKSIVLESLVKVKCFCCAV